MSYDEIAREVVSLDPLVTRPLLRDACPARVAASRAAEAYLAGTETVSRLAFPCAVHRAAAGVPCSVVTTIRRTGGEA